MPHLAEIPLTLERLGWSRWHADRLAEPLAPAHLLARVAIAHTDRAELLPACTLFQSKLPSERLHTGDWVVHDGERLIQRLPRRAILERRSAGGGGPQLVAANLDLVFIVSSMNRDFNPRRLERYLAAVHAGGATPIIVLTKADLAVGQEERYLSKIPPGVDALVSSVVLGTGIDALRSRLTPGRTVCFVGSSGAGKSSLVNAIVGEMVMETGEVRDGDDRGRHTTTRRELKVFDLGVLVDTPGMRELGLVDAAGLDTVFSDVVEAASRCQYRDCRHVDDEGCAVLASVDPARLASWRMLRREASQEALRGDDRLKAEDERQKKRIVRRNRARTRSRDRDREMD